MTEVITTAATPLAHALSLPHGLLAPSPTNPRKRFDAAALAELADSIAEHGVMQPLAARPNPLHTDGDGRPPYELVCGERRWRACGLLIEQGRAYPSAGHVPVLVRDYTDAQVLALQALENVQRQDLHPMEEADHYHLMVSHPLNPATVAEVAQLIGKSISYVQARLNLRRLGAEARQAFMDGLLDFSKALRVSAMPAAQQPNIVQHITTWGGEPMGVRAAERFIVEQHTLLLTRAPWNLADAGLLPEAGSCTDCTQRTDRQPGLFESATDGDRCLNGACWGQKRQAHHDWLVRNAEAEGYLVARGDRAASIMRHDSTTPADGWHDLSARVPAHLGDSTTTVEQVVDRANVPAENITVLDQPGRERLVYLVTTAVLRTALTAIGTAKSDRPDLELQGQQQAEAKAGKTATPAPVPAPDARDGAPPRVAAKRPAEPEAPAWNPLDDLLAFDVLPGGQCNDALVERCRGLAIERTVACLAVHRACSEVRDRGLQLNALLPAALACTIGSTLWMGFDVDDCDLETMPDLARLAGIHSAPPVRSSTTPYTVHRDAMLAWIHGLDRTDATCLTYALLRQDTASKPGGHNWRHLASAMGIAPDPLLAEATTAVDERLRLELMKRSTTTAKKVSKPPAKKAVVPASKTATKATPKKPAPAAKKATAKASTAPSVKYRDAATGSTWTGRGLQPAWLKAELANGAKLADFEVQA